MADKKIEKNVDFRYDLKLYWGILKKYKLIFFLLLALVLVLESFQVVEKYLFKVIVDNSTSFESNILSSEVLIKILVGVAIVYSVMLLLKTGLRFLEIHLNNRLDGVLILDLKRKFFNHLISLSHNFHTTHKTGSLISRLSRGGRAIERFTDTVIFNFAPLIFQFAIASTTLFFLEKTSAIIITLTVAVFIGFNFIIQRKQQPSSIRANDVEDIEKGNIGDIFTNIDSIKYFGKEKFIISRFENLSDETKKAALKNWDYFRALNAGQSFILGFGTIALIYSTMTRFLAGILSIGDLVFIYTVFLGLLGPLYSFVHGMRDVYRVMADFDSLFQYYKIENEVKDKKTAFPLKIENGELEFKKVSFDYGERQIFNNLNLKINKNEKIALVGHSGSGKTTLVKLLYRLYDIREGGILVDNKNIDEFTQESLRQEMSIVPQECILFDDTVYNNVAFSNPNAKKEEVMDAIKFAQLDKIISKFPKKENTIVGERGVRLSGGEKQRVSIARAILANKKILVLDEATSSLDSETEHEIQKDLQRLMKNRTSIIIAHRLSTIMSADRIIVLKDGKIIQEGKHSKLINQAGEYRKLWNLQKGGYLQDSPEGIGKKDNNPNED